MSRREKIIAIVMLGVVGLGVMTLFSNSKNNDVKVSKSMEQSLGQRSSSRELSKGKNKKLNDVIVQMRLRIQADTKMMNDPFKKIVPTENSKSFFLGVGDLNLSGIIFEKSEAIALINDKFLRVGESVGDFVVKTILKNEVVVVKDGKEYRLRMMTGDK